MTEATRAAIVTIYQTLRDLGPEKPRNAIIFAAARGIGHRFRDAEAKHIMAHERGAGPERAPAGPLDLRTRAPIGPERAPASHDAHVANGISLSISRIEDKGSLPYGQTRLGSTLRSEPADQPPDAAPVQKILPLRVDRRSPAELVADDTLDRLRPLIEPELTGIPWSTKAKGAAGYRERNRKHAVSMAAAGKTADDIVEAYLEACDRRHVTLILDLKWVQEDFDRQKPSFTDDAAPTAWVHLPDDDPVKLDILRRRAEREAAVDAPLAIVVDQDPRRIAGWLTGVAEIKARVHGGVA